ncbi:MAG: hypothetical protein Q9220_006247 [cf. Caloplaca sp. 1 TL-2023]
MEAIAANVFGRERDIDRVGIYDEERRRSPVIFSFRRDGLIAAVFAAVFAYLGLGHVHIECFTLVTIICVVLYIAVRALIGVLGRIIAFPIVFMEGIIVDFAPLAGSDDDALFDDDDEELKRQRNANRERRNLDAPGISIRCTMSDAGPRITVYSISLAPSKDNLLYLFPLAVSIQAQPLSQRRFQKNVDLASIILMRRLQRTYDPSGRQSRQPGNIWNAIDAASLPRNPRRIRSLAKIRERRSNDEAATPTSFADTKDDLARINGSEDMVLRRRLPYETEEPSGTES